MNRLIRIKALLLVLVALGLQVGTPAVRPASSGERRPHLERVDVAQPPFSAIGRLNNASGTYCTGVLVGRRTAVTAAHCLRARRAGGMMRPASIHFLLGYERGEYSFHSVAESFYVPEEFDPAAPRAKPEADWALIRLKEVPPQHHARMPLLTDGEPASFVAVGYARERRYWLTSSSACAPFERVGSNGLVLGRCHTAEGYSGGPLIDPAGRLVGIQIASGRRNGEEVVLGVASATFAGSVD